jgi:alpha-beta hydrolase superfamily lysophospholipase
VADHRPWLQRVPRVLFVAMVVAAGAGLPLFAPGVAPPAQAADLAHASTSSRADAISVPVTWFETSIEDPTRWTPARGSQPAHPGRTLRTTYWYPTAGGPWPVIVFAHGFNTNPWTYEPLLTSLASAGYIVAAPDFPASSDRYDGWPSQTDIPNQPGDLSAIVTATIGFNSNGASPLAGRVDVDRFGAAGHSDGGATVAALVLNSATFDARIRASAILAGAKWPIPNGTYGPFNNGPVLIAHGDADPITWYGNGIGLYQTAAAPKALLQILGGSHIGPFVEPTAQGDATRRAINAFFDRELRGDVSGMGRLFEAANRPGLTSLPASTLAYQPLPFGVVEAVDPGPGTLRVSGWALDDDTGAPIPVAIYVDGVGVGWFTADAARPDIANAYPGYGDAHGFATSFPIGGGPHTVCVYGINAGFGDVNPLLSCRAVTVGGVPNGALDAATGALNTINVSGWSIDPDTAAAIPVAVYVDGIGVGWFAAANDRPDVAAAYPGYGSTHGYSITFSAPSGTHQVCVYGINQPSQVGNPAIGCTAVTLPSDPIGVIDAVWSSAGAISAAGWAIDPDTATSIPIAVYVDGTIVSWFLADAGRPDVAAAFPGYGPRHGYHVTFGASSGQHHVCVYAINQGKGTGNPLIDCRAVTVA